MGRAPGTAAGAAWQRTSATGWDGDSFRSLPNYQSFHNCLDDAYVSAIRTGNARIDIGTAERAAK
jgi:hypothetical protein